MNNLAPRLFAMQRDVPYSVKFKRLYGASGEELNPKRLKCDNAVYIAKTLTFEFI